LKPTTAHWTVRWTVRRQWLQGCKLKQNANEGCNSCATVLAGLVLSFIACFILLVIAP